MAHSTYEMTRKQVRRLIDFLEPEDDEDNAILTLLDEIQGAAGEGTVAITVAQSEVE